METKMDDALVIDAFEHIQVPLIIIGPDGVVARCNAAANRMFGYDDSDMTGGSVFDTLPFRSVAELNALIQPPAVDTIVKGVTGRKRNGETILLAMNLTAWTDAERGPLHALALTDIGEDYLLNRASKDELERANSAIRGARIGIFEYNPVDDSVIVSDIWRALTELDTPVEDVQADWLARVHPDDREAALAPVQMCIYNGCERATSEHRYLSKDGLHWRWMRADLSVAKRDRAGKVSRVIGAMIDITDRKTIENSLRISQEQFRSAFEDATVAKAIIDLQGRNLRVNRAFCEMTGYPEQELLQTNLQSILHPDDFTESTFITELLNEDKDAPYQVTKRFIRASGAIMWGLLSGGVVKSTAGVPENFVVQIADVTEQRRFSEMKSEFVAIVSHELRTPLTSVLGSLSLLSTMTDEPLSDEAQRLIYIAQENGERLNALINDILDFEKFSVGQMRFSFAYHRTAELIDDAILVNMASADKLGVTFSVNCADTSDVAFIDARRFQQVMTNLLSNAAKFAKTGSAIDVSVERQSDFIKISVINIGEHIPDSFREDAFKPFAQLITNAARKRGGTGLGLNICKQIVDQMGGAIGFESEAEGRTTFWFTVPVDAPA
jgi:PAS domain S-box-containing protein